MLRLTVVCAASLIVTTVGLSRFSDDTQRISSKFADDTQRISDDSFFDERSFSNYDAIIEESSQVLQSLRATRKTYKPKKTVPYPSARTDALRLLRDTTDYLNLFRGGKMPSIIPSESTKEWFKAISLSTKNSKDLGGNTQRRAAMIKKAAGHPAMYIGLIVDFVDLACLTLAGFFPEKMTWIIEPIVFLLWWATGVSVFMTEGGYGFIESMYALMQMPTTIGFGDMLPDQDQYGLKMFHAAHIAVSSLFVSGKTNYYIDILLDGLDKLLKRETAAQKMLSSGIEFLVEGLFSTFFYAWEFNTASGQSFPLDMIDSFYMTIIGLTTVGYGDFSPQTEVGRGLGFLWGHFGTETAARFFDNWDQVRHDLPEREIDIFNTETGQTEKIMTSSSVSELVKSVTPTTTGA